MVRPECAAEIVCVSAAAYPSHLRPAWLGQRDARSVLRRHGHGLPHPTGRARQHGDRPVPSPGLIGMGAPHREATSRSSGTDAALLDAFARHLATLPARTGEAYRRDVAVLKALAGEAPLTALSPAMVRQFLGALHGRGLSGRSLARMLSGWRSFYRFALDHDPAL